MEISKIKKQSQHHIILVHVVEHCVVQNKIKPTFGVTIPVGQWAKNIL